MTLLELLLVLVIAGLLFALALPPLAALRDRLEVEEAARLLVAAHLRARFLAIAEQRTIILELAPARLLIRAVESPADSVLRWETGGPAARGVEVTGMPRRMAFGPSGIGLGVGNATYRLRRGGAVRSVVVSRYGRVRLG